MNFPTFSTILKLVSCATFLFFLYWGVRWWANVFHLFLFIFVVVSVMGVGLQKKPLIRAWFLTCLTISMMWLTIEYGFLISNRFYSSQAKTSKTFSCGSSKPMGRHDKELGYRGVAGPIECTSKLLREPEDVHKSTYTLDEYGFRLTPGTTKSEEVLVFFGGSNMVGELVNDNETLPYYVSESFNHRYSVVNLGWSGWGPHQMLRLIEVGIVREVVNGPLHGAVLKTAIWHTQRVLGYSPWDQRGPKYQKQDNETLTYMGPFKSDRRIHVEKWMKKSSIIQWIFQQTQTITANDIELYIDVIVRSSALLEEQFGVPLTILFWPSPDRPSLYGGYTPEMVIQRLKDEGLTVLEASDVLNYRAPEMRIVGDGHPTPLAYKKEAQLISSFFSDISNDE